VMVEPVYHYAIERGMNYIDISRSYLGGLSIKRLGEALKGRRHKVYLSLKYHEWGSVEEDLRDLRTDYTDFLIFNQYDRASAADPRVLDVFGRYKKAGKARFAALMTHSDVKGTMAAGIRSGMYAVVAPSMSLPAVEILQDELRTAQQKGIGVFAMKTMRGLRETLMQVANLKQLLRNPAVTSVLKGISSYQLFDAYMRGLKEPLTAQESHALQAYARAQRSEICMMCDTCKRACPLGAEVSTVLRCLDYYYGQMGDLQTALTTYSEIPVEKLGGPDCQSCRRCEAVCPNRIAIVARLDRARQQFLQTA